LFFHKSKDLTVKKEVKIDFIEIGDKVIERVYEFKYLGLTIDPCMTFSLHYKTVLKKISQRLSYLRGFKRFFNEKILRIMVNAHIYSVIDYGIDTWAVQTDNTLDDLQRKIDKLLYEFEYPSAFRKKLTMTNSDLA